MKRQTSGSFPGVLSMILMGILFSVSTSFAQGYCPMGVSVEPRIQQVTVKPGKISQTRYSYLAKWLTIQAASGSDDEKTTVVLPAFKHSSHLLFSDFNAQIPAGATIHGIEVWLEGQSTLYSSVAELSVTLLGAQSGIVSVNKANTAFLQKPWSSEPNGEDKKWCYGGKLDTWGIDWDTKTMNASDFTLEVQIRNATASEITAWLDDITMIIHYTPLYTLCKDSCAVFYVDPHRRGARYQWHVPENFMAASREDQYTINLKTAGASPGTYTLCADIFDNSGNLLETCCRQFNFIDCASNRITGLAFEDTNNNRTRDSQEPLLSNITLFLKSPGGQMIRTATTDVQGRYEFGQLPAGTYYITAQPVTDLLFVPKTIGVSDDQNSDVTSAFGPGTTSTFVLSNGISIGNIDFGFIKEAEFGDKIWHDLNYNGLQDIGEPGLDNVLVELRDAVQNVIRTGVSDADGMYRFTGVYPGTYSVFFQAGQSFFSTCQKENPALNSNINTGGSTPPYNFLPGSKTDTIDAGFVKSGTIGGFVFEDRKANGYFEAADLLLPELKVILQGITACGEMMKDSTRTDISGKYQFSDLKPGLYTVSFDHSGDYQATVISGQDSLSNRMAADFSIKDILLESGTETNFLNGGFFRQASVSGVVWNDENVNSFFDNGEKGIQGVSILLDGTDAFGNSVNTSATTNAAGRFVFNNLIPGQYRLFTQINPGYGYSPKMIQVDTTRDNNSDNGAITDLNVCSGQFLAHLGIAVFSYASTGDRVWEDVNGNGIFESGEPGIPGIAVALNGTDAFGNSISEITETNSNGLYRFQALTPGTYQILLSQTADYKASPFRQGNDNSLDSDIDRQFVSDSFELSAGENNLEIDAGLYKTAEITGFVWEDLQCDGTFGFIDRRLGSVAIRLQGLTYSGQTIDTVVRTFPDGTYSFQGLDPGDYQVSVELPSGFQCLNPVRQGISLLSGNTLPDIDFVLFRYGLVGDFVWLDSHENGVQDTFETGIDGLMVSLEGFAGGQPVSLQTVTEQGYYRFENVKPGEYRIRVDMPAGFQPTTRFAGSPDIDSDIDSNGQTDLFLVISGAQNFDMDAGFAETARGSIGDYAWMDENGNGLQDAGESGLEGILVSLAGTDNLGNAVNVSVSTDENGYYSINNLREGWYTVNFALPAGFGRTTSNAGNGSDDSKPDVISGDVPEFFLPGGYSRDDIDAGYYREAGVGDKVWFDGNENGLQDAGEPGLEGIRLSLYEENNPLPIVTVLSDSLGHYRFSGLKPGFYYLVSDVPSDKRVTILNAGDPLLDNDFQEENLLVRTPLFFVGSGQVLLDKDMGLYNKRSDISGIIWRDKNANGLLEDGEIRYAETDILLINASGDTIAVTETDSLGFYLFTGLEAGLYRVIFPLSDSLTFTRFNAGMNPEVDSDVLDLVSGILLVNVTPGEIRTGLNAGYVRKSSIGDYVWLDANENGLQEADESGINGVTVYLYNLSNVLLDSAVTSVKPGSSGSGFYLFQNILPGDYYVSYRLPENLLFTVHDDDFPAFNSDVTGAFGVGTTERIVLDFQENNLAIDAGLVVNQNALGQINGVVWEDVNANGTRETVDLLLDGVEVTLYDIDGTLIDIVFTDQVGRYQFNDVFLGSYYISVADVINRVFVLYNGQNTDVDSDIANTFGPGTTRIISLFPGDTLYHIDLGYAPKISLGDFVWEDLDFNGLQDPGEPGVGGLVIQLLDAFGNVLQTTTTDLSGFYLFDELAAGRYGLRLLPGADYLLTTPDAGSPSLSSKADLTGLIDITDFTVTGFYDDLDFGLIRPAAIGSRLWLDLNGNGIYTQNEPGIPDVIVELYTDSGMLIKTTKTGPSGGGDFVGTYRFSGVRPGSYYVRFVVPPTYLISESMIGSPDTDSDITGLFGRGTTNVFFVATGENKNHIDGAAYLPACIGDRVWNDVDKNGNQDTGEHGIGGVLVSLYTSTGILLDTVRTDSDGRYKFYNLRSRLYYIRFSMQEGFQFSPSFSGSSSSTDSDVDETGTTPLISLAHGSIFLDVDAGMFESQNKMIAGIIWDDKNRDGMKGSDEAVMANIKVSLYDKERLLVKESYTNHAGHYLHIWDQPGTCFVKVDEKWQYKISKRAFHTQQLCNDINLDGFSDTIRFDNGRNLKNTNGAMFYSPTTSISGFVWKDTDDDFLLDVARDSFMENTVVLLFSKQNVFIKSTQTSPNGFYQLSGLEPGQYYVKIPRYTGLDFLENNESDDSHITHEKGIGTSMLFMLDLQNPKTDFNLGYKTSPSLLNQPEEGIEDITSYLVYPNPTIYNVKVDLKNVDRETVYQLFDNQGRRVRTGRLQEGITEINMIDLPQGMYILEFNLEGKTVRKKVFRMENY